MSTLGLLSDENTKAATTGTSDDASKTGSADETTKVASLPVQVIPRYILAFRTISLLLSQLQNRATPTYVPRSLSQEEEKEVKIGDAFAHLAVTKHDIVAIATQRSRTMIEVTAVSEGTSEGGEETSNPDTTSEQVQGYRILDRVYQFFFTKNPQFKERDVGMINKQPFPAIVTTTPILLGDQTIEAYLDTLQGAW